MDATLNALNEGGKTEAALAAAKVPEVATDSDDGKSEVVVPGLPLFPAVSLMKMLMHTLVMGKMKTLKNLTQGTRYKRALCSLAIILILSFC